MQNNDWIKNTQLVRMGARSMFSKFKSSGGGNTMPAVSSILGSNPISNQFEIGKQSATAGPENVWRVLEGYRKSDGKEVSIFLFEKRTVDKIYKPKRKETITEMLRLGVRQLERCRHPKILQVVHTVEECPETLAFVSEPVFASLANIFAADEQRYFMEASRMNRHQQQQEHLMNQQMMPSKPNYIKKYDMLDIEIKYGLLQCTDALLFLHNNCQLMHRNLCPSSIIITKKGTWKLFGFDFVERTNERDPTILVPLSSWINRLPKITQPNLDFIAPEVQQKKMGSILSDMYSLGMIICSLFNHGRPLIQANNSITEYLKQIESLENLVDNILPRVSLPLQEAVTMLLRREPKSRPTASVLALLKYFSDPSVHALQFLDVINMKDPSQKSHFYKSTLLEVLPYIPKKLWYQHIWPYLQHESRSQEVLASVLQPMIYIIENSNIDDYENIILPNFRLLFSAPRSIQATVVMLENLHIILEKSTLDDITREVLPILYNSFESNTIQIQTAAFIAVTNVVDYIDDMAIRGLILPKLKHAFENRTTDQRILMSTLGCILDRLEKQHIIDDVLPLLWKVKLHEPEIIVRVVNVYRLMLSDKKYGLPVNIMATHVMPSLLPQTVNPGLTLDNFTNLLEVLQEMLNHIDNNQRNKLKLDNLSIPSPEKHRPLRHQYSSDNMNVPPFNIPNLRIEQRKTSSAEDMARKNSIGSMPSANSAENMTRKSSLLDTAGNWIFGSSTSANADSNFLEVANNFMHRRLSDNSLMTPKIKVAPSCASSPGGTPGAVLPIRRHSSTCPHERRGSNVNLSPPTGSGFPLGSSSVPYLLSSSLTSIRSSQGPSVLSKTSQQGSGLLQQFGSGMVRQHPPICLNLNGPQPPTLSPSFLQPSGQPSH